MQITDVLLATLLFSFQAAAKTVKVEVGSDGLAFNPTFVTAAMGDMVEFSFYPQNHSVVQADYTKPCMPMSGGIYSAFIPSTKGEAADHFTVTISNTNPIWLYCAQAQHCQAGMVAVINPPSGSDMTLDKFTVAARSATTNEAPMGGAMGGTVSSGSSNSSSSGSSSSSVAAGSMSSSSMAGSATASSTMSASSGSGSMTAASSPAASSTAKASTAAATSISADTRGIVVVIMAGLAWIL